MSALAIWQAVQTVFGFVAKHWKWALIAGLVLYAAVQRAEVRHWKKVAANNEAALTSLAHTYAAASEKARADAEAAARVKEQHYAQVQEEQAHAYETKLSDARARLAQWVRDHQGNSGAAGGTDLPRPAEAAGATAGAGENALVPVTDLDTCAVNTTKAQAWLEWWSAVSGNEKEGK